MAKKKKFLGIHISKSQVKSIGKGINHALKPIGHDIEAIGKFTGKQINKVTDAGVGLTKAFSSPLLLLGIAGIAAIFLLKK